MTRLARTSTLVRIPPAFSLLDITSEVYADAVFVTVDVLSNEYRKFSTPGDKAAEE
jgi:hypothetical protein